MNNFAGESYHRPPAPAGANPMATQQNIDAIILAGGQGLRMGGHDKGLKTWQSRPLIEHVIERIAPQVDNLHISANRNLPAYQKLGYPVHTDTKPDFLGPLAGIAACAPYCESDWVLIAPLRLSITTTTTGQRFTGDGYEWRTRSKLCGRRASCPLSLRIGVANGISRPERTAGRGRFERQRLAANAAL